MAWILIAYLMSYGNGDLLVVRFNDGPSCEAAAAQIKKADRNADLRFVICAPASTVTP